ncbi:MAG: dihydroorotase family protein [Candidatus Bathyarchaeia archaeon]
MNRLTVDLVIKNGKLVSPRGVVEGGVAIDGGVIVSISKTPNLPDADTVLDAGGKVVLPGVLDGHPHTSSPPEDPGTGTRAAAHGGITTILDMPGTSISVFSSEQFERKREIYEESAYVDFSLHGACASGYPKGTLTRMWEQGATGIKFFVSSAGPGWPQTFDGEILDRFRELAQIDGLALIHAENDQILRDNLRRLRGAGRRDYAAFLEWRPPIAEIEAGQRIIRYLRETGARGLIVHTSLPETVRNARKARLQGTTVHVESCPQYLYLTEDDVRRRGPWVKFAPPARSREAKAEMWRLLRGGWIDTVASDHAPYSEEEKERGQDDIFEAPNGIPGLETLLPLMLTGVNEGRLSLERLAAVTSENPARIYGIYPRKGALLLGSDGDLVIVDMKRRKRIRNDELLTACGWSPYEGYEVRGVPVLSVIRGNIVLEDGEVVGSEGLGTFIRRLSP